MLWLDHTWPKSLHDLTASDWVPLSWAPLSSLLDRFSKWWLIFPYLRNRFIMIYLFPIDDVFFFPTSSFFEQVSTNRMPHIAWGSGAREYHPGSWRSATCASLKDSSGIGSRKLHSKHELDFPLPHIHRWYLEIHTMGLDELCFGRGLNPHFGSVLWDEVFFCAVW